MKKVMQSVFRPGLLDGKTSIVTGGGSGIGMVIAHELASLGSRVIIASRSEDKLKAAAEGLNKAVTPKFNVDYVKCNIRDEAEVKHLMTSTTSKHGSIDILVNNGGGQFPSPAAAVSSKGWNAVIDTNLTGTFQCCREAYTASMAEHGGTIVNIVADMWRGFPGMVHTGAARAGVVNITKTLAVEWAASGVRVNSVAPGIIYSDSAVSNYDDKSLFARMVPFIPAKRLGTPEEVSAMVTFLCTPAASFITGETVRVDGGASLWASPWPIPPHSTSEPFGELPDACQTKDDASAAAEHVRSPLSKL